MGKTIGNNFFFGVGNADRTLIGSHATFLDVIAKFGIFCGGAYVFATVVFCISEKSLKEINEPTEGASGR